MSGRQETLMNQKPGKLRVLWNARCGQSPDFMSGI
jgi:hypothetical protein